MLDFLLARWRARSDACDELVALGLPLCRAYSTLAGHIRHLEQASADQGHHLQIGTQALQQLRGGFAPLLVSLHVRLIWGVPWG